MRTLEINTTNLHLCLITLESSEYDFALHVTTNDNTNTEYEEIESVLEELVDQVPILEGITLTNVTDIDKQFTKEANEEYVKIVNSGMNYNPADDPEIEHTGQQKKKITKRFDKDYVKSLVSQADLFGLSRNEACKFINRALNPDNDDSIPEFTTTMYASWLGKLKEHKILFFEYYSRSGIFEDVYDVRATMKMVYQILARQFRMEVIKGKDKDKTYVIKLAETINTMSDEMMRVSMSSPFISGFKSLMDYKNSIIDEIKRKHPSVFANLDIKSIGSKLSIPEQARSSTDGLPNNAEGHVEGSVLERLATQEEGAGAGEGDIPEPTITRGISETNSTARDRLTERIF